MVWLYAYYDRLFDEMRLDIIGFTINLSFIGLIDPKAIHFTHKLHAWFINMTVETCYHSYRSDFYGSDLSLKQFTYKLQACFYHLF